MKLLLQNHKTGELKVEDVPAPAARPNGVIVRNLHSLVSIGTERATVAFARRGLIGKARSRPDLVRQVINKVRSDGLVATYQSVMARLDAFSPLGYSSAGEVIESGDAATGLSPGDLVACAGSGYASHAEVIYVPNNLVSKLPPNVETRQAAFTTIGAIALQGIRRAELTLGERVAVIGLGLVGQLTVQLLNAYGFPALGADVDARRVQLASTHGLSASGVIGRDDIEALSSAFSDGVGIDAVIVTAATSDSSPIQLAGRILRERGRVSVVGDVGMDVPRRDYYAAELDLRLSRSYGPGRYDPSYEEYGLDYPLPYARWTEGRNMQEFLRLLGQGRLDTAALITHTFPIDRAANAYALVVEKSPVVPPMGVLIEYPHTSDAPARRVSTAGRAGAPAAPSGEISVGLIGAGSFAQSTILPALRKLNGVRIRAVASAGGHSARETAARHGADYATTRYQELIEDDGIDLIVAATRHNLNAEIAVAALAAGKHVHVEKPLAITRPQLQAVTAAAARTQAILNVGFNRRFAPSAGTVHRHFEGHAIPLMLQYRVNAGYIPPEMWVHDPVEGGGRIIGEVCHFVDFLQFITGAPPSAVYASRLPPAGRAVLPDDNIAATVEFADGSRGVIIYSALGAPGMPKEQVEIMGERKSAVIEDFRRVTLFDGAKKSSSGSRRDKGHLRQFELLVNAVRNGGPPPIPLDQILLSSLATICITESLARRSLVPVELGQLEKDAGEPRQAAGPTT